MHPFRINCIDQQGGRAKRRSRVESNVIRSVSTDAVQGISEASSDENHTPLQANSVEDGSHSKHIMDIYENPGKMVLPRILTSSTSVRQTNDNENIYNKEKHMLLQQAILNLLPKSKDGGDKVIFPTWSHKIKPVASRRKIYI